MNVFVLILVTLGYIAFCSIEIALKDILHGGMRARTSDPFVRRYRRLCHVVWFLMYAYFILAASKIVPSSEAPLFLGLILIVAIVGFIWIQEPKSDSEHDPSK